jgi:PAS domain S-box-containing protein
MAYTSSTRLGNSRSKAELKTERPDPRLLLSAIVDSSDDAIISKDLNGFVTSWNPASERLFGYTAEEMMGQTILTIMPPELRAEEEKTLTRVKAGERIEVAETERLARDGRRLCVSVKVSPIRDDDGRVIGASLIVRDISERRQADAIKFSLSAIVESSDDAIIGKDLNGIITSWNRGAERLFGYKPEEIIGKSVLTLIPKHLQSEEPEILARLRANQRIDHYETQRVSKSGKLLNVSLTISPIRDRQGNVIGVSKIARDISERTTADELRIKLAAIVESSDDAIVGKDLNGVITSWNAGAERLFGYKAEEIIGQSVLRLIPEELQSEEPEILARLRADQRIDHYETQRISKTGERLHLALTISPIRDAYGRVIGASKIARDISERKRAQMALIESEKLAATARMAATIAHEINNPLESVTNLAYLLSVDTSLSQTAHTYAELLLKEISRASDIARQTLSFYRDSSKPDEIKVANLLSEVLEVHEPKLTKRNIRVKRDLDESAVVWGFSSELRQVFVNLLLNASDALNENGELAVRVKVSGSVVKIFVCDNGCGIPRALHRQIFEPFFTTKRNSGNGLGLWVSSGIVKKHDGRIRMRSSTREHRHGTVFQIQLPFHGRQQVKKYIA